MIAQVSVDKRWIDLPRDLTFNPNYHPSPSSKSVPSVSTAEPTLTMTILVILPDLAARRSNHESEGRNGMPKAFRRVLYSLQVPFWQHTDMACSFTTRLQGLPNIFAQAKGQRARSRIEMLRSNESAAAAAAAAPEAGMLWHREALSELDKETICTWHVIAISPKLSHHTPLQSLVNRVLRATSNISLTKGVKNWLVLKKSKHTGGSLKGCMCWQLMASICVHTSCRLWLRFAGVDKQSAHKHMHWIAPPVSLLQETGSASSGLCRTENDLSHISRVLSSKSDALKRTIRVLSSLYPGL